MSKTKTVHSDPSAAFSEPVADVLLALNADERGLTSPGASQRLTQYGPNELPGAKPQPIWLRLLSQFNNALIWFMLCGALAAGALGHLVDAGVIQNSIAILARRLAERLFRPASYFCSC